MPALAVDTAGGPHALLSISLRCSLGSAVLEVMSVTASTTGLRTQSCVTSTFHNDNRVTDLDSNTTGATPHGR